MASNFIQPGSVVSILAPYDRTSGQGVLRVSLFGVALGTSLSGIALEIQTDGVWDITKATGIAFAVGDPVYWDDSAKNVTDSSTGNTLIGVAMAIEGTGDTTARVRLNGSFS